MHVSLPQHLLSSYVFLLEWADVVVSTIVPSVTLLVAARNCTAFEYPASFWRRGQIFVATLWQLLCSWRNKAYLLLCWSFLSSSCANLTVFSQVHPTEIPSFFCQFFLSSADCISLMSFKVYALSNWSAFHTNKLNFIWWSKFWFFTNVTIRFRFASL